MGNFLSLPTRFQSLLNLTNIVSRKRKLSSTTNSSRDPYSPEVKRFRFDNNLKQRSTDFKADVVINAFDRKWPCNREILCQSNFFKTLLNGSFKESKLQEIDLYMTDDLINEISFQKLLNILYHQESFISSDIIFNVTVTAQYFQIDSLVDFCEDQITEMIKSSNAIEIYHFSDRYYLKKIKDKVFDWMLLRLFPVTCWDQLSCLSLELATKLISHPRLVTLNEMYLYLVLKMLIQIDLNGTYVENHDEFYSNIKENMVPFLLTEKGLKFRTAFEALKLGNILVRKENVEMIMQDNIIPRSMIYASIYKNWMSLISIESHKNYGPSKELITENDFDNHAMRFAKVIHQPDFHCWKFAGFCFAFDLALFFDGRTLIIKRVHQFNNEQRVSHTHLLRSIMLRVDIVEVHSTDTNRQNDIQTYKMTLNEEISLKKLNREPKYPCRISLEILFHIPYVNNLGLEQI
ncbi:CLUMA_CG009097, isoform A [Clunio marinus]|uniref:CLUMA_CG009097, isoform A n=1 Tax=Clunio marinus TaxID=568069 RepID=A0A1J1I5N7_9DIPT|nr:CLUMA_CG009097, isoform A [Clunio marinus]